MFTISHKDPLLGLLGLRSVGWRSGVHQFRSRSQESTGVQLQGLSQSKVDLGSTRREYAS